MQKALFIKTLIIVGLMFIIGVPLLLVQATIRERIAFRNEAVASVAADSVREQTMIGPILVLPYTDEYEEKVTSVVNGAEKTEVRKSVAERRQLVFPETLKIEGMIDTDHRYRGIHQVLVYSGQYAIAGNFNLPVKASLPRANAGSRISLGKPFVALSINDVRGIRDIPGLKWDGRTVEFEQGSGLETFKSGMHASVPAQDLERPAQIDFSFDLGLSGIERQHIAPVGKNNKVTLKSNWPHPQFSGRFLPSPKNRRIDDSGFSATWDISALATDAQQQLRAVETDPVVAVAGGPRPLQPELDHFTVGFIEPVNVYSLAERATKYGLLFVALTFAAFFVFEILKRLPIHPVQYALVGLALVLFFLLLVGLSEHIVFVTSYLIASAACIVLIAFYLSSVLHSWKRGYGFGAALTMLYGALYGLLISENNALVLGSILLFAVLAAVMVATRKVDWYRIGVVEGEPA
ncbi:MAG: cell envelope integrity protein CreD [Massilia sp.]